jgi:N-acetyl sugar amidotransferase
MGAVKYCARCILPDTRPGIFLDDEGVCSGCRGHDDKELHIDWAARAGAFDTVVAEAKQRSSGYDCIVPVSGGKDSWYQVIICQKYGLKVLGVTWRTPGRTEIGQRNVERMISRLCIDHIDFTIAPDIERRFMITAYAQKGATAIPMHMALFAIPTRLAVQMRIPLVVWGENPQLEFGGAKADRLATELDLDWIAKHGVTNQTSREDWIGAEGLTDTDLAAYHLPPAEDFKAFAPKSIFLGSFFKWNSFDNAKVSSEHGFESGAGHLKTGVWSFADIDCNIIALHHFLKWYKFGILRSFDNLSVQIRYGQTTRDDAIKTLRQLGFQVPTEDIARFCDFAGKPTSWFWDIAESFRDETLWRREGDAWEIPDFLIDDWDWAPR